MARDYIERRDDALYIAGSRVPLEVVIHEYKNGAPPESIAISFPTLSLEQIYGALAFYHGNEAEVEEAMRDVEEKWERFRAEHPVPHVLRRSCRTPGNNSANADDLSESCASWLTCPNGRTEFLKFPFEAAESQVARMRPTVDTDGREAL